MAAKTCFVIIGFGEKKDLSTKRVLDMDKTYREIIQPAFEELGYLCYRANDIIRSGIADIKMYENILKADFVVADISTLNPNVLYELGIRHALRPYTTIVISEDKLKMFPFDINHVIVEKYEHLGKGIDHEEVMRFRKVLKDKVEKLSSNPETDSPVYTFIAGLKPPEFTIKEVETIKEELDKSKTLSKLLEAGERAKDADNYKDAREFFQSAYEIQPNDPFIIQRYALSIYQSKIPNQVDALFAAEMILSDLDPESSTDPETLGLAGAINKRLYEQTKDESFLSDALNYYERGFFIKQDHYTGINAAYLFTIRSIKQEEVFEAYADYGNGMRIRRSVIHICKELIEDKYFDQNRDNQWILQSLAQAYLGLGIEKELKEIEPEVKKYSNGEFDLRTFVEQNEKLTSAIRLFKEKYKIE